jgi:hypothetical protein
MQNKANFKKVKLNVTKVLTKDYDQLDTWSSGKNKPNSNPIQTQFKANQSQNKPNTNPKQSQFQSQYNTALHLFTVGYLRKRLYSITV